MLEEQTEIIPKIAGRYRVMEKLGSGSFGDVISAWDERLERLVAIKRLRDVGPSSPDARARFLREMKVLAKLDHPNIVPLYDAEVCDSASYLSMKLVNGHPLDKHLGQYQLGEEAALEVARCIALALEHAHGHDVLHRDLKPSNILIDKSGQVFVVDFGLATLSTATAITQEGMIVGTPKYMAPEVLSGQYTAASDLYALGAILYEMVFGEPCFDDKTRTVLFARICHEKPPHLMNPPTGVSQRVLDVLGMLLEKSPAARPESAAAAAALIDPNRVDPPRLEGSTVAARHVDLSQVDQFIESMTLHNDSVLRLAENATENLDQLLVALSEIIAESSKNIRDISNLSHQRPDDDAFELHSRMWTLLKIAESMAASCEHGDDEDGGDRMSTNMILLQFRMQVILPLERLLQEAERKREEKVESECVDFFSFDESPTDREVATEELLQELTLGSELHAYEAALTLAEDGCANFANIIRDSDVERRQVLLEGFWRFADVLISKGRAQSRLVFEAAQVLESDPEIQQKWRQLYSLFKRVDGKSYWPRSFVQELLEGAAEEDRRVFCRALLYHPNNDYRALAFAFLEPHDFWWVITDEGVPLHWLLTIWRHLKPSADINFFKIFFVSVRGRLLTFKEEDGRDMESVMGLLKEFYEIDTFHEAAFFEMLNKLHTALRAHFQRHQALFDFDQNYVDRFNRFLSSPKRQDMPVGGWGKVPLPIQRLLARRGHFAAHFACHPIDPIALECLSHILRCENVGKYLELYKINSKLLHEISKETRFFRDERSKLLLVSNPKTSQVTVARYISFLRNDHLNKVLNSRDGNQLARKYAERILKRRNQ